MKITIEITPDNTLTEADFVAMCKRADDAGETPDAWAAKALRKTLYLQPTEATSAEEVAA